MSSSYLVSLVLAIVFAALAALHVYWAIAGGAAEVASAAIPTRTDGAPLFRPSARSTLAVAAALVAAAVVVLGRGGVFAFDIPTILYQVGAWGLAAVLLLRAVGDFRYVGLFKRERQSVFARWDSALYSPLCAVLAAGVVYLAIA